MRRIIIYLTSGGAVVDKFTTTAKKWLVSLFSSTKIFKTFVISGEAPYLMSFQETRFDQQCIIFDFHSNLHRKLAGLLHTSHRAFTLFTDFTLTPPPPP